MTVNDSADSFAIEGNTTAGHGIGLKGSSTNAVYGTGVYGISTSGPGIFGTSSSVYAGVMGISTFLNGTGILGRSSGDAVYGLSSAENGVLGATRTSGITPSGSGPTGFAGVLGLDQSTGGSNYGVVGESQLATGTGVAGFGVNGAVGVFAQSDTGPAVEASSSSPTAAAVTANNYNGPGIIANTFGAPAVYGQSFVASGVSGSSFIAPGVSGQGSVGVYGIGQFNDGPLARPSARGADFGLDLPPDVGVVGTGETGLAGFANQNTDSFASAIASALYLESDQDLEPDSYEIQVYCSFANSSGNAGKSTCPNGSSYIPVMTLDASGNMVLGGTLTTQNDSEQIIKSNSSRAQRVGYGTSAATPTLEDTGEAALSNGVAAVRLDPAFADSIDRSSNYMVFVTPMGDTNGLYVATRTAQGFVVREHGGARSNVVFDYRIAARPAGSHATRMPFFVAPRGNQVRPATRNMHVTFPAFDKRKARALRSIPAAGHAALALK